MTRKLLVFACTVVILSNLGAGGAEAQVLYGDVLQKQMHKHSRHAAKYRREMADMYGGYAPVDDGQEATIQSFGSSRQQSAALDNRAWNAASQQRNAATAARAARQRSMYAGPPQHQWFATPNGGMVTKEQLPQNWSYKDFQYRGMAPNANHLQGFKPAYTPPPMQHYSAPSHSHQVRRSR